MEPVKVCDWVRSKVTECDVVAGMSYQVARAYDTLTSSVGVRDGAGSIYCLLAGEYELLEPGTVVTNTPRAGEPEGARDRPVTNYGADNKVTAASDPVHRPHHYARYVIEPIEFIMKNNLPFWLGNVVKYGLRYDAKDGIQDLKKARRYLDMQIKRMEGDDNFAK